MVDMSGETPSPQVNQETTSQDRPRWYDFLTRRNRTSSPLEKLEEKTVAWDRQEAVGVIGEKIEPPTRTDHFNAVIDTLTEEIVDAQLRNQQAIEFVDFLDTKSQELQRLLQAKRNAVVPHQLKAIEDTHTLLGSTLDRLIIARNTLARFQGFPDSSKGGNYHDRDTRNIAQAEDRQIAEARQMLQGYLMKAVMEYWQLVLQLRQAFPNEKTLQGPLFPERFKVKTFEQPNISLMIADTVQYIKPLFHAPKYESARALTRSLEAMTAEGAVATLTNYLSQQEGPEHNAYFLLEQATYEHVAENESESLASRITMLHEIAQLLTPDILKFPDRSIRAPIIAALLALFMGREQLGKNDLDPELKPFVKNTNDRIMSLTEETKNLAAGALDKLTEVITALEKFDDPSNNVDRQKLIRLREVVQKLVPSPNR